MYKIYKEKSIVVCSWKRYWYLLVILESVTFLHYYIASTFCPHVSFNIVERLSNIFSVTLLYVWKLCNPALRLDSGHYGPDKMMVPRGQKHEISRFLARATSVQIWWWLPEVKSMKWDAFWRGSLQSGLDCGCPRSKEWNELLFGAGHCGPD